MADRMDRVAGAVIAIERELGKLRLGGLAAAAQRWRGDAQALLFHLRNKGEHHALVVVLGGTGTGKSTIVNRLVEAEVSAASFRRTFTSGAVGAAGKAEDVPDGWLGVPRDVAGSLPVRGEAGRLVVVGCSSALAGAVTLVDTPDLDGDQAVHHAEADRAFRWAEAVLFVVTPEKYQMTELLPYYRLAQRYAIPALFVLNKCEEREVLEDYRRQLAGREWPDARVFAVARDDAGYEPAPEENLGSLRQATEGLGQVCRDPGRQTLRQEAAARRSVDLLGRLRDHVLWPMRDQRRQIDQWIGSLRAMTAPAPGIDVSPVTQQLQRRLQEQSILYLMGPQRILDRVRQVPGLLMRLPRTAWDVLAGTQQSQWEGERAGSGTRKVPDFPALLSDQLRILQSRIDDVLQGEGGAPGWLDAQGEAYAATRIAPEEASRIAEDELAKLKQWLEQRWNRAPRDTAVVQRLLKYLPGGKSVTRWSEAAPYLLAVALAAHGALFGHVDLLILGSYGLTMWAAERLSNEVAARTRQANRQMARRYADLAKQQIDRVIEWLGQQVPTPGELGRLERLAEEWAELL